MELKLKGKKALITGGTSGIGRATSIIFAEAGIDVAVNYCRNDEKAFSLMQELSNKPGKAILAKGDISDYQETRKVVEKAVSEFGTIDILVHSAGIPTPEGDTPENWDRVMRVHLYSCYNLEKFVVPIMKKKKSGKIVIVSSLTAHTCGYNAYCVAQAGKICFAKGLAKDLAPYNINVNTVSPGTIFTPMLEPYIPAEKRREFTEENIPLYKSKPGYPEGKEVAKVILFLASSLAEHITGEDIIVDGGQFIHS
ncbi:MAG: SDR family oxidoreductase [Caldiserica bacterium]|nr:SDR family oxidoreductase [Caldisericota bacterium]